MPAVKDQFVSLHMHSDYSLLDGYAKPGEYIKRAIELGQPAIGLTDHGNLHGIKQFIDQTRDAGLTPVPGSEFYMAPISDDGPYPKHPVYYGEGGRKNPEHDVSANGTYLHLTVWAYNDAGLSNLKRLSTLAYAPERYYRKPRIGFDDLADHSDGLIVSTGCPSSEISTRLLMGQEQAAYEYAGRMKEVFKDQLFMEIMNHNMSIDLERKLLPQQMRLAKRLNLPLLATNDCHYANSGDAQGHSEMLCIQSKSLMSDKTYDQGGKRFALNGDQYYMKSGAQMAALFPEDDYPGALSNTLLIAEMASDIRMVFDPHLRPTPFVPEGTTVEKHLQQMINDGYKAKYVNRDYPSVEERKRVLIEAKRRIREEWEVIYSSAFDGYMLVVEDYLRYIRENYSVRGENGEILASPLGPGRGSVGGCIIAYLLGISEIDPIEYDLLFERFLSPGRGAVCRVTYDDGTTEDLVVSETRTVLGDDGQEVGRYIHQINVGDEVVIEEEH